MASHVNLCPLITKQVDYGNDDKQDKETLERRNRGVRAGQGARPTRNCKADRCEKVDPARECPISKYPLSYILGCGELLGLIRILFSLTLPDGKRF